MSYFMFERMLAEVTTPDGGFVDGQDNNFAPPSVAPMLTDRWASTRLHQQLMNPQLLILEALANDDIVDVRRNTLRFDVGGAPLVMNLDRRTGLPVRARTTESDALRRDVRMSVHYDNWTEVKGLMVPMEVTVRYDGEIVQNEIRSSAEVNADLDLSLFDFPAGIEPVFDEVLAERGVLRHQLLQSFAALGFPRDGLQPNVVATEVAPGVHFLTGGSHNSLAVVQSDGVTIVEAPLDEVRSAAIADWVDANLGLPITHVVASHHHADHSAGVRQFARSGATAVVHEDARRFFRSVFRARSRLISDDSSDRHHCRRGRIVTVPDGGSRIIENAINPVGVHTLDSEHAGDLVMIDVGGVLFVVDIYNPGLPVTPEAARILPRVLELGLDIDLIAGGHGGTIPWDDFVASAP